MAGVQLTFRGACADQKHVDEPQLTVPSYADLEEQELSLILGDLRNLVVKDLFLGEFHPD